LSAGSGLAAPVRIKRPSAFGDWRRSAHLVWVLARTELRQRYAQSMLGYLWTMLEPVMLWVVLYLVIRRVLQFGGDIDHYAPFLLLNITLYFFFRNGTTRGFRTIRSNDGLLRKMEFPRGVLPISAVVAAGLSFLGSVPVIFAFLLFGGVQPMWTWLLFPLIVIPLFMFTCGMALLLAAIFARVADLQHIWPPIVRILFWSTPIIYAIESIPGNRMREIVLLNPLSGILEQARIWMIDPSAPGLAEAAGSSTPVLISLGIFLGACVLGPLAFARAAPRVVERL
jgi:ABC-2 type transport system permease protein